MAKIPPSVGIRECFLPDDGVQNMNGEWIVTPRFVKQVPVARHREQIDAAQAQERAAEDSFWGAFRK